MKQGHTLRYSLFFLGLCWGAAPLTAQTAHLPSSPIVEEFLAAPPKLPVSSSDLKLSPQARASLKKTPTIKQTMVYDEKQKQWFLLESQTRPLTPAPPQTYGQRIHRHANGQIAGKESYLQGKLHGTYMRAYFSGQKKVQGRMEKGRQTGEWKYWYPNGQTQARGTYYFGLAHGTWQYWDTQGEFQRQVVFHKGKAVREVLTSPPTVPAQKVIPSHMLKIPIRPSLYTPLGVPIYRED